MAVLANPPVEGISTIASCHTQEGFFINKEIYTSMKIYEPNYTQVPNAVISLMPKLTESELKVMLAIMRKTLGWQKNRDRISLTQLEKMTGLGRASVSKAIKSDKFNGVIKKYKTKKGNEYEVIIHELDSSESEPPPNKVVQNLNQGSSESEPVGSSESEHTKETITKETIQKKGSPSENIPTLQEVKEYFRENGYSTDVAEEAFQYYQASLEDNPNLRYWRDSRGNKVRSWKMKMRAVWFKDEAKVENSNGLDNNKLRKYAG